ncbi:Major facilitator superfamily domain-containing protein 4B [Halotydeus destructor]|nr:Major facilitator superfamily domain-containing protein 4B [Halotydeus destructor]
MEPSTFMKRLLTLSLCGSYMAFGVGFSMMGSILDDMEIQLGSTLRSISFAMASRGVTNAAFSLIFGYVFRFINRQLALAGSLILLALTMAFVPFIATIFQFSAIQAFYGIGFAALQVCINAFMLEIWKQDSNLYMQIQHTCFCIGSIFGPLIARPFHYAVHDVPANATTTTTTVAPPIDHGSQLWIPIFIACGCQLFMATVQIVFFFVSPYQKEDRTVMADGHQEDSEIIAKPSLPKSYYYTVILSGAILLCFEGGIELNAGSYLQTFAHNVNPNISISEASYLGSGFYAAFAVSRVVNIFLALKLRTVVMIWIDVILIVLGTVIIFLTAATSVTGLWIGVVVMGIGFSSCWPGVFSFVEERISVTDTISGIFNFFTGLHPIAAPFLQGLYIQTFPMIFAYINLVSAITVVLSFIVLHSTDFTKAKILRGARNE